MQGVQNPASLNLELPQQSVNQNGLLESNGEVNTSSSVLEDSFNNFIQEGGQLPLNPNSTRLNVLPRAYEEQFNNVTQATPQVSQSENINTTNNDFVDFGNGITLPKELLPEEKTKEEFNKEIAESAKDVTLKQSGKLETFDIENPKWISKNRGNLQGEEYVNAILQDEKEGKVKVARNDKGELIDEDLKPILDNSNVLWQPIGSYINDYNNYVNKFNKEIELNNQKISTRNAIRNSAYISSVYEAAELEKNARENFIARYGQANYDKYGVLPPQVMDRLQYEERVQNYVSQGYTEQEAVQYANTYRERELQGVREENNFILNNIFSKLKAEDSQERQAWSKFAENYPKEFRDFFNEYTEKFGDEAWDNSYLLKRFDNPMRRASIKDEFINYLKTLQVYSQIELKNKEKQAKADVRFGVLPPQVMDRLQYEERVQNYVSQGYTEQEALQYANTYRERELQGVREENNFILNNIFSKLKAEDSPKYFWQVFGFCYSIIRRKLR